MDVTLKDRAGATLDTGSGTLAAAALPVVSGFR